MDKMIEKIVRFFIVKKNKKRNSIKRESLRDSLQVIILQKELEQYGKRNVGILSEKSFI
jgi:hypothetical protein